MEEGWKGHFATDLQDGNNSVEIDICMISHISRFSHGLTWKTYLKKLSLSRIEFRVPGTIGLLSLILTTLRDKYKLQLGLEDAEF